MALKILIAEDEDFIRELNELELSDEGYEVILTENGQQAWEEYQKQKSGLSALLTDIDMPVMNGLELIKKIRQDNLNFPIIAYTGREDNAKKAKEAGANLVLAKPYKSEELISAIEKAMEE